MAKYNKMDNGYKKLYIKFCELLEQDGRNVICYTDKPEVNHLLRKTKNGYEFYINRLTKYLAISKTKTSRQKLLDKYNRFLSTKDLDNLSEFDKGYYCCLQQLMVAFNYLEGHDVYKPKITDEDN